MKTENENTESTAAWLASVERLRAARVAYLKTFSADALRALDEAEADEAKAYACHLNA